MTSPSGVVNEGTENFTLLNGNTVVGTPPAPVNVVNGVATVTYALPAGTAIGTYTIQAVYNGTINYTDFTDTSNLLTVGAAATTTTAANSSVTFSPGTQNANLSATVSSGASNINEGTFTFTILSGTTVFGSAATGNVANGIAAASYPLPAGLAGGSYTIQAVYNGTTNFAGSSDDNHSLMVGTAATSTAASAASATYSTADQPVALSATVTSSAGTVDEGTETFTLLSGGTTIGTPVTVNVLAGAAAGSYTLPGGTAPGMYTIKAVYNGTENFVTSSDTSHVWTVSTPPAQPSR